MDTLNAYYRSQAATSNADEYMVFDWNKAATLIKERGAVRASAGLESDWEWTGGSILENGEPVPPEDTYVFLSSSWATPEILIDGEPMDCFILGKDVPEEWGDDWAHVYWPQSALDILNK